MITREDELRKFIWERINSVEQISVLSLLSADPQRDWTTQSIARNLRSTETSIQTRLDHLYASGVLNRPESGQPVRYSAASEEMARLILVLLDAYKTHPNRVIDMVYSRPAQALQAFADSFKLRKD